MAVRFLVVVLAVISTANAVKYKQGEKVWNDMCTKVYLYIPFLYMHDKSPPIASENTWFADIFLNHSLEFSL